MKTSISSIKKIEPNLWAMIGGSVILGENSKQAIVRELKEELNIDIDINNLEFLTKFKVDSLFVDTYVLRKDFDINKMILKQDEVCEIKWLSFEEIEKLVNEKQFFENRWKYVNSLLENI